MVAVAVFFNDLYYSFQETRTLKTSLGFSSLVDRGSFPNTTAKIFRYLKSRGKR